MLIVKNDYKYKYGETYVKGLLLCVPSFLYPGEKPQQITYEFRDKYFASEASRSSIAGTAFSSIMEAQWNFGYIGIVIMYIIYGYTIKHIENKIKYKNIFNAVIYLCIAPCIIRFHRSALGDIVSYIILMWIIGLFLIYFPMLKRQIVRSE